MASEAQYDFFKYLYDEEAKRYVLLDGKAKLYITIVTFYLGAIAFKFKDVLEFTISISYAKWLYSAIALVLVGALLCTVNAVRVRLFEGVADPEEIIRKLGDNPPTDDDFRDDRIADFAVATNKNYAQNNRIAKSLSWASVLILSAGMIQFLLFLIVLVR
jgi:hypothetical protein